MVWPPGHVLVGLDGSPASLEAGRLAVELCQNTQDPRPGGRVGPQLTLLRVVPPGVARDATALEDARAALAAEVGALEARAPGLTLERAVLPDTPIEGLLASAALRGSGLIVVGTAGRSGLGRLLLGSVAEGVLRRAPCPVLVVSGPASVGGAILCADDGSESAARGLDLAAAIARQRGAPLRIVQVVPEFHPSPMISAPPEQPLAVDRASHQRRLVASARARLERAAARFAPAQPVAIEVLEGDPVAVLAARASADEVGLVVVGTRHRASRWARSHAAALARTSPVPVLAV